MSYEAVEAGRAGRACPDLPGTAQERAARANTAARAFIQDLREYDPRELWGRLRLMEREDLEALVVSLAARCEPPTEGGEDRPLDWCRPYGGVAAFHPDYRKTGRATSTPSPDQAIIDLWRGGLRTADIARRLGLTYSKVQRAITRHERQKDAA